METGQPSRMADSAARYRAAHQVLEQGSIFKDPLAVRILGVPEEDLLADAPRRGMRLFVSARSRYAEDALAEAVAERGIAQLVMLGRRPGHVRLSQSPSRPAGRRGGPPGDPGRKAGAPGRGRHLESRRRDPPGGRLERDSLADRLRLDGPAFFFWLGVVPYLTRARLRGDARLRGGGRRQRGGLRLRPVARPDARGPPGVAGGPGRPGGRPGRAVVDLLRAGRDRPRAALPGFVDIEDLGPAELAARFFHRPDVPPNTPGGHVVGARSAPPTNTQSTRAGR